ncbi:MAG: DNA-binding response regulator [Magnetococcales bacterium]|nr:DNA-binding response regulator [Magnetococcales bacterium]HIJ85900.1 response regulator [Magnetococcales bacterium]
MAKVLVVDDEPPNCLLLEAFLRRCAHKHSTKACHSGADAIALSISWKPDLVFMDIHMPGLDGIATIKSIREKGFSGKIVIVTADHRSENARLGAKAGANGFLAKPVDGKNICSLVDQFVTPS